MKIGAKAARRGRFIVFRMAEVAVPWSLFAEIPRFVGGPRPRLAPA